MFAKVGRVWAWLKFKINGAAIFWFSFCDKAAAVFISVATGDIRGGKNASQSVLMIDNNLVTFDYIFAHERNQNFWYFYWSIGLLVVFPDGNKQAGWWGNSIV